ncbi:MAG: ATP synthase F0 subunit B [Deltaproteobacteria bacterium]|nr:ATP synthase F0 subunit B [Deltaproteobacteria bacterium]
MIDLYPNETFFIQWALFLTAFLLLRQFVFLPTLTILKVRREKTEGAREKAARLEKETSQIFSQIEVVLAGARNEGMKLKEALRQEALVSQAEVLKRVRETHQKKMSEAQEQIEKEGLEATLQLRQYAQQLGHDFAEKILERPI